ncbi:MAG TPA: ATP-binding protein [Caulobacteraceae bacterium]|nr:ATP-binding protein [Caulobacteraceae bacterium]
MPSAPSAPGGGESLSRDPNTGRDSGARLFAASARNFFPRLISTLAVAGMAAFRVGPLVTLGWFVLTWTVVLVGVGLAALIQRRAAEMKPTGAFSGLLLATNVVSSGLSAGMAAAIWMRGDDIGRVFALATLFIGAAYVLLHYYAEVRSFCALVAPYGAALGFICLALARGQGDPAMSWFSVAAIVVSLINFFYLSRLLLARSRAALRHARRLARDNEKAASAANAAKTAFLAKMSHEIRTPLNGVLGMAQAMDAAPLSAPQRGRLTVLRESGEALLGVVNDILDLSKIEAGKVELESIPFDLSPLLKSVCAGALDAAARKGLELRLEIGAAAGRYQGDPARLRQIVTNLTANAVKFTETGGIEVRARSGEGLLFVSVADTGPGIAADDLPRLFGAFSQLDASVARRYGGSGLGLAICQQLAQLMGGCVEVKSALGAGSTFTVGIPLERLGEEEARGPEPTPLAASPDALDGARLLVAEDNPVNQLVLRTLLEPAGACPTIVADGAAAVAAWEANAWDAILMDIEMPTLDGVDATRRIRERERASGRARTPIIALSANAMSHQVREYLAAGMDDHVPKPIDARRLHAVLASILARGAEPAAARAKG